MTDKTTAEKIQSIIDKEEENRVLAAKIGMLGAYQKVIIAIKPGMSGLEALKAVHTLYREDFPEGK